ncbi:MAG: GNAT family N-acetyltransferase [Promethearchaeota archaeon]
MKLMSFKDKRVDQDVILEKNFENLGYNNSYISKMKDFFLRENANSENEMSYLKICLLMLNPVFCSKRLYQKIFNNKINPSVLLLKNYEYKIYRKYELTFDFFGKCNNPDDWHYGYQNKTHYLLNGFNEIIGCLNLIFLSIYNDKPILYLDTIEIRKNYRRKGLGSRLIKFIIKQTLKEYEQFYIFLLVVNCEQFKLKFFSQSGFIPVKLRKTEIGTHCIMSYPFDEKSEFFCERMFEYFNWREEKKEFISSDCKYAYNPNPTGLYWCVKKNIYVTGLEKQSCKFYQKEKEIINEKKFLDFQKLLK